MYIHIYIYVYVCIYTLDRIISGAKYSGVPQSVHVLPLTRFAKPKSVTFKDLKFKILKFKVYF